MLLTINLACIANKFGGGGKHVSSRVCMFVCKYNNF